MEFPKLKSFLKLKIEEDFKNDLFKLVLIFDLLLILVLLAIKLLFFIFKKIFI